MELETTRLHLRPLAMTDAEPLYELHQDADMQRYFGDGHLYDRDESRTWLEWHVGLWDVEGYSFFAADLLAEDRFVGWVGLNKVADDPELDGQTEIGWFIDRAFWRQGLATEEHAPRSTSVSPRSDSTGSSPATAPKTSPRGG